MSIHVEGENLKKVEGELLRYILAAGSGAALDLGVFTLLVEYFGMHYIPSNAISWLVGVLGGYYLCVRWVFPYRRVKNHLLEFLMFCLIGVGGMGVSTGVLWIGVDLLQQQTLISKIVATGFQFAFNFTLRKLLLFAKVKVDTQSGA